MRFALPAAAALTLIVSSLAHAQPPEFYKTLPRLLWVVPDSTKTATVWEKTGVPVTAAYASRAHSIVTARFANIRAHWIQPRTTSGAFAAFLKSRGPGVIALAYLVPSHAALAAEKQRLASLGVRIIEEGDLQLGASPAAYTLFDTAGQGKIVLALLNDPNPEVPAPSGAPAVTQFAITARNLDAVSAYWARLGFPAFTFTEPVLTDPAYRGKPADFAMRLGWQRHLSVPFEWIEPHKGPTVYDDHIAKHGEGFHHIAFNVTDMDAAIARWSSLGYPVSMSGGWGVKGQPGSGRFAYHDLHTAGGIDIELLWNYPRPPR